MFFADRQRLRVAAATAVFRRDAKDGKNYPEILFK
jgi:hypothetical protein